MVANRLISISLRSIRDFQGLFDFDFLGFPDALKPAYDDKQKLGAGSFGVTYLATRKAET